MFGTMSAGGQATEPVEEPIACAVMVASGAGLYLTGALKLVFLGVLCRSTVFMADALGKDWQLLASRSGESRYYSVLCRARTV